MGIAVQSVRRQWGKRPFILVAIIVIAVATLLLWGPRAEGWALIDGVILRLREAGPVVFFVAMAVLPAVGFPLLAFTLAGGPVFGPILGAGWVIAWSLIAVTFNLLLTYWLGVRALRPSVRRLLTYFDVKLPETTGGQGWQLALIVRLTPGPPFWLQSYALAVVRVPLVPYLVVSIFVIAGYIIALVCGGAALAEGNQRLAVVAAGALVAGGAALLGWQKRFAKRSAPDIPRPSSTEFALTFGPGKADRIDTGIPVIAGDAEDNTFGPVRPAGRIGSLALFAQDGWLIGATSVPLSAGLEETTREIYRDIFVASQGRHLARIWNYIPAINETGPAGLPNYQLFSRARSFAFEQQFGPEFKAVLPAASAVGTASNALTVVFAACPAPPRHLENPQQTPAYDYPPEHGPRPPAFARATVSVDRGQTRVFISGTAAIRGHFTVAPNDLGAQLDCTLDNLRSISEACGLGRDLNRTGASSRTFKVYLRRPSDQPVVAAFLTDRLLRDLDRVTYLQSDICRTPLLVEIEVTLLGVKV